MLALLSMLNMFSLLPMFSLLHATGGGAGNPIRLLIYIVVIGLIFWLLWWFLGYVKLPQPFDKVARVLLALLAILFLIGILLSFAGISFPAGAW